MIMTQFYPITLVVLIVYFSYQDFVEAKLTDVVKTKKGPVRGEIVRTVGNSIEYSAFRGIPYAKPPIKQLRFKPPLEVEEWTETINATVEPNVCPQLNSTNGEFHGDEDCLYLNVYTPKTQLDIGDDELLAVMVWIYGGGFYEGTIDSHLYGPDFLIEANVVIVAMNYRLGALGFLTLNHSDATGNAGLKDQVLALKWVRVNIKEFGGDPKRVTIFGQSAGSDSVLLHQISDASKGLFNASIAMSGSPLNPWGFYSPNEAVSKALQLGRELGLESDSKAELLQKLYNVTSEKLVRGALGLDLLNMPFKPTFEDPSIATDVFLSDCVITRLRSGNFSKLPTILGFVQYETLLLGDRGLNTSLDLIGRFFPESTEASQEFNETRTFMESTTGNVIAFVNFTSDLMFVAGIDEHQQYLDENSVYYYRNSFDYSNSFHKVFGSKMNGTAHSDDTFQIFWLSKGRETFDPTNDIGVQRMKMVKLWTNFAKYYNPTPLGVVDTLLNVSWTPSGIEGLHLEIGQTSLSMESRPVSDFVKKLQKLGKILMNRTCRST